MGELEPKGCEFYIIGSDEYDKIKWLTGTKNTFEIQKNFHEQAQLKRWCEENCEDVIVYLESSNYSQEDEIYFFSDNDAAAYKLRWS